VSRVIPPNNRADGDPAPAVDNNNVADMLSLITGVLASSVGTIGASDATNVTAVGAWLTAFAAGDWVAGLIPSGDTTGTVDVANMQGLINLGCPLRLGPGRFWVKKPIVAQVNGVDIHGVHGATPSGDDAGSLLGTVISVTSGFSNPSFSGFATAVVLGICGDPGTGVVKTQGFRLRDLWIDGSSFTASAVDGVAYYGPVNASMCERVGVWNASGNAFAAYPDSGSGTAPDGPHYNYCLAQSNTGAGFFGKFTDASFTNCHAQGNTGDGWFVTGGNNQLLNCRADLCANGYTFDHPGGSDGYDDYNAMANCTTQRNAENGLNLINTSSGGTAYLMPVKCTGCAFTGDGTAGSSFAGVSVQGVSQLECHGCSIRVYTVDVGGGCPSIGIKTATPGVPTSVTWDGGSIQCASGGDLVSDAASVQGALRIGPSTAGFTGYASSAVIGRTGSAVLSSGTVTVSNAWVTSSSRIYLTSEAKNGSTAIGVPQVSARTAGSFTITSYIPGGTSTQTGDASTVGWQLVSQ
jgi:hypothetical protein